MKNIPNKFRPSSSMTTKSIMRERRKHGSLLGSYNWQSRVEWYPAGYKLNRKTIFKQYYKKHFGSFKASVRYLNNWSCHNWL
jgi:hypothetical protein